MNSSHRLSAEDDPVLDAIRSSDPLEAARPWPVDTESLLRQVLAHPVREPHRAWKRNRLRAGALVAAALLAIPAVAFADTIGGLLGISNQGTTVAASDTPFSGDPKLYAAMQQLGLTTMQLIGGQDGISLYAARNPAGHFCFALSSQRARGIGCRLDDEFPSMQDPLIDMFSSPLQIAGLAADGVSSIAVLDASGTTLTTIPVSGNVYVLAHPPAGSVEVEALDANGQVVASHSIR